MHFAPCLREFMQGHLGTWGYLGVWVYLGVGVGVGVALWAGHFPGSAKQTKGAQLVFLWRGWGLWRSKESLACLLV